MGMIVMFSDGLPNGLTTWAASQFGSQSPTTWYYKRITHLSKVEITLYMPALIMMNDDEALITHLKWGGEIKRLHQGKNDI